MSISEIKDVIQTERKCVSTTDCDRNCGKCSLVMDSELIIEAYNKIDKLLDQLDSLKSEYNSNHTDSDYWRGIRHCLEVLNVESLLY